MPQNPEIAMKQWRRYAYARDTGHNDFVKKASTCVAFLCNEQWQQEDLVRLRRERRPALTVNKILSTVSTVQGEQIYNRAETTFRPRGGAAGATADALAMVFKQISDNNQLAWLRSDMFLDGIVTGRGYLDVRIDYEDSLQGEVRITHLNPKNVLVDPDAEHADPDTWGEVFVTKWMTLQDIAQLYGEADATLLKARTGSALQYGYDSINERRDRFGKHAYDFYAGPEIEHRRRIRVIDRQYRELVKQKFFATVETGDLRPVPRQIADDREAIAAVVAQTGQVVIEKPAQRIKWTVTADDVVLHDDWSPFKHFTVVAYFPKFMHGPTLGIGEELLSSQELMNKTLSQELHVVNTTANSGWIVKRGALTNMTPAELEQKGAMSGLVMEVDEVANAQKITPNQVPTGLDRVSYKAEEHIKTISGVSDSMQGFDREDVAAKAIQAKRQAGSTNLVKPMDSLTRTDFWIARAVLDLVQEFYTEPRLITITKNRLTGDQESVMVNEATPEGEIANNLTMGEYDIIVSSVPQRETLEDSQFEQAVALREMGVAIPDDVLIQASRLQNKADILKAMKGDQNSPEAQAQARLQQRAQEAEVLRLEGEAAAKHADAGLRAAKAEDLLRGKPEAAGTDPQLEWAKAEHERDLAEREFQHEVDIDQRRLGNEEAETQQRLQLEAQTAAQKSETDRIVALQKAASDRLAASQADTPRGE